ncbi:MAG TPA: methyltransferase domain-containing protein [Nitrospirota bacterium]|nr:methyltransferase domain-containing protein [Nitrospirota bacterium]
MARFIRMLKKKIFRIPQNSNLKEFDDVRQLFFDKNGIEIGGPSNFFKADGYLPIYSIAKTLDGVNYSTSTVWTGVIRQDEGFVIDGRRFGRQFIADAVDLSSIKDKYDFLLSCNNIEHIANPMKAVEQWLSVLKDDGILLIVAPRKESNFDHYRSIVAFDHVLNDYNTNVSEDDSTHLREILLLHDLKMDPPAGTFAQFVDRSLKNHENRCFHHHVFDLAVLRAILTYFHTAILKEIQLNSDYLIIGRKN